MSNDAATPRWRTFLDELVANWKADAPTFDAGALRDQLLAVASPSGEEIVEHLLKADGQWLERHAAASVNGLILALRHPDHSAQLTVDAVLGVLAAPATLPALMSVIEQPSPLRALHLGGRPQHFPSYALIGLGRPDDATAARLIAALQHKDERIAEAAAKILAEFSAEDRLFAPLFANIERAEKEDGVAWALMRAAEVRRDPVLRPFLEWMQKTARFKTAGYGDRIDAAIAGIQ